MKHIGSTLTSFLEAEGIKAEVDALTHKKVRADDTKRRKRNPKKTK